MYFSAFLERFALLSITLIAASRPVLAVDITGAGATFPYPIYAKWAEAYKAKTGNNLNYQSIGSGGGIRQIQNKTVDFGASDMPLKPEELDKSGLVQFPTVVGGDVPVVNLPGIKAGEIKLTGPVLADIYLGKVKKWNDPVLTSLNRSEEHTSELQSRLHLVCRLLLEKKKKTDKPAPRQQRQHSVHQKAHSPS